MTVATTKKKKYIVNVLVSLNAEMNVSFSVLSESEFENWSLTEVSCTEVGRPATPPQGSSRSQEDRDCSSHRRGPGAAPARTA